MLDRPDIGERTLLVNVGIGNPPTDLDKIEFKELAYSAGAEVIDSISVTRHEPDVKYLVGTGKVDEIQELVNIHEIDVIIFNYKLSATQERNLEEKLKTRVLDKTGLILDIFAQRARTFEGKLQVELAQLEHLSTRLIRGWTHLERQKGGIGLRGPGETQLEVDRRLIGGKIQHIKARLAKVKKQRTQSRSSRQKSSIPTIALVGYTNAGKSTLFNKLTTSDVLSANKLFATLDTTLSYKVLPKIGKVIFSDTVGFIKDLPHELIDAFKATLEEVTQADLLLHVVDYRDEFMELRKFEVENILTELNANLIPKIYVYNKIDLVEDMKAHTEYHNDRTPKAVSLSAHTGNGIILLESAISSILSKDMVTGILTLPPNLSKVRSELYELSAIIDEYADDNGNWHITISLPSYKWNTICKKVDGLSKMLKTN